MATTRRASPEEAFQAGRKARWLLVRGGQPPDSGTDGYRWGYVGGRRHEPLGLAEQRAAIKAANARAILALEGAGECSARWMVEHNRFEGTQVQICVHSPASPNADDDGDVVVAAFGTDHHGRAAARAWVAGWEAGD